jgi:GNAT superfamily N-acetyltransferase
MAEKEHLCRGKRQTKQRVLAIGQGPQRGIFVTIRLRELRKPEDLPRIVALENSVNPEPTSVAQLMEQDAKFPIDGLRERVVALDDQEQVIGFGICQRVPWMKSGKFGQFVSVDQAMARTGVGHKLITHLDGWAKSQGATLLQSYVRDNLPGSVAFALAHGFQIDRHVFESTLDLATFDEARFAGTVAKVTATGIQFITMADRPGDVTERDCYETVRLSTMDVPGNDDVQFAPFETWRKWAMEGDTVRLDCIIMAVDGDHIVGVTAMKPVPETGAMYTHYTGVHPAYRGRKLSLALKLLAVAAAKRYGAPYMRTNNDSQNLPMLATNRKLGYVPCPGEYRMYKEL